MPEIDPTEHDIAELGPKIKDIDDEQELEEVLAVEKGGEGRAPVLTLIEDRLEKVDGDEEEVDPSEADLTEMTIADVANTIRDVEDIEVLQDTLEREKAGKDRKGAKSQIEKKINNLEEYHALEGAMNTWLALYAACYGVDLDADFALREAAQLLVDTHNIKDVAEMLTHAPEG